MNKYKFIVIEGNIGAGKTSLARLISDEFNAKLILEQFADNPFLPKFYADPERYSFPLELSFLAERYNQMKKEFEGELFSDFIVSDYFFSKSMIFARSTLKEDEFNLYRQIFNIISGYFPKPELYIYLFQTPENLLKNIRKRGRNYEQAITPEYLEKIQQGYFEYFRQNPELRYVVIDCNEIDFVGRQDHYEKILHAIFGKEYPKGISRVIL
jgi:deoxyadenosine/deoxycytidine kinase